MIKNKTGFTLIEAMISITITTIIGIIGTNILISTQKNYFALSTSNKLKVEDQRGINKIGQYISSSVHIIGRDASTDVTPSSKAGLTPNSIVWHDYIKKLDIPSSFKMSNLSGDYKPLAFSSRVLPSASNSVVFLKEDPSFDPKVVGNSLLLITQEDSVLYKWNHQYAVGQDFKRVFNLFQFHYFYLAKKDSDKLTYGSNYLLIHWSSNYFLDYNELSQLSTLKITDPNDASKISNLVDMDDMLDDLSSATSNSGFSIPISGIVKYSDKTTGGTASPRFYSMSSWDTKISYNDTSFIKMWSQENILRHSDGDTLACGIAPNSYKSPPNASSPQYSTGQIVPLFANTAYIGDSSYPDGFPHGFESMLSGSSGGKKVFMRVLSKGEGFSNTKVFNESVITFQGRSS